jgi:hypothetical protein
LEHVDHVEEDRRGYEQGGIQIGRSPQPLKVDHRQPRENDQAQDRVDHRTPGDVYEYRTTPNMISASSAQKHTRATPDRSVRVA